MSAVRFIILLAGLFAFAAAAPFADDEPVILADDDLQWRLPTNVTPIAYHLTVKPYLRDEDGDKQFTFDGEVFIEIQAKNAGFSQISLHQKDLNYDIMEIYDKSSPNTKLELTQVSYVAETNIWTIEAGFNLNPNVVYVLHFNYTGHLGDDMHGFYRSSYMDEDGHWRWLASTQFQTHHARRAFPCFDEPSFKANFTVSLIHHKSMKTYSNTERMSTMNYAQDWIMDTYTETPKMSTYLLAFIISGFNERFNGQFGVIARPEYYAQTKYSYDVGQEVLDELDNYLGVKYYDMGIPKMHMAAIPDFSAGAMENWGLLTYRERALLYDPLHTTLKDKQYIATVVAHEQAHMWFGDYVTCDWWSYTWLNEGFARFFQYYATNNVEKDYHLDKQFTVDQVQTVMNMDSLAGSNPLSEPNTNNFSDLSRMFNSISYNKGASVIRMTKHIMGEQAFQKSLQTYLKDHAYGNVVPLDLWLAWQKEWPAAFADDLERYFKSFTEQEGYPVITVNVSASALSTGFVVTQQRFLLKDNDGADKNLIYHVPFTYTTDGEKNFDDTTPKAFITNTRFEHDHKKNFSWVIANVQQSGYYRVNYDTMAWHRIHSALYKENFDGIHELNRAQIVDDLLNLARAGHIEYELAFDVLDFLQYDTHYATWTAAFNGFNYLSIRMGMQQESFANYILAMTDRPYQLLGFVQNANDTALDIYNRAKVLAWVCKYGHPDCISKAKGYFKNLSTVPVNIRSPVYCTGIREGTKEDFDHLWRHAQHMNVASETTLVLNALGCTKDPQLVKQYFETILTDEIRRQDKNTALTSLYSENNENVDQVFDLVTSNVDALAEAMGGISSVANTISNIAARFTTTAQEAKLKKFNTDNKQKFGASFATLEKAELNVADNLNWGTKNVETIHNILMKRVGNGTATLSSLSFITLLMMALIALLLK